MSGKYAYIASVNNNSLVIDDISNPSAPTFVSKLQDNTKLQSIVDVYVVRPLRVRRDRWLRNSPGTGRNSLAIIDVSNPAIPTFVSEVQDDTRLSGSRMVFVSGNYAHVTNNNRDSFAVINVANPITLTLSPNNEDRLQDQKRTLPMALHILWVVLSVYS